MEAIGKQQLRTHETRCKLLDAAEEVFIRDGYEGAQLDAIAEAAGRSKGAVYGHFKNKEDLFLALFEDRIQEYTRRLEASVSKCTSQEESLKAFKSFFLEKSKEKSWSIMNLEFKLYALRHPESQERLMRTWKALKATKHEEIRQMVFGKISAEQHEMQDRWFATLAPIMMGLNLESFFEKEHLNDEGMRWVLSQIFDLMFDQK